ncbi:hypothetical protein EUX98_g7631 [Antrodiella citrinella]|uniref:Uncharacterized protein n=1 Tax=Antrodiella citrinella TaxID=2447956 RepID=A0A4S4MLD1_9APHY|nr:hypothetical protein EUX98_g7631 [Antrodiella citrinella]
MDVEQIDPAASKAVEVSADTKAAADGTSDIPPVLKLTLPEAGQKMKEGNEIRTFTFTM